MALPDLSKSEYAVLKVLWSDGELSFREVHDRLDTGWAYTTTKTVMDRMATKGLLEREKFHGVFIYRPTISRAAGLARMVKYFAESILEADTNRVVAMFAENEKMSDEELEDLRQLIDSLDD
ncbi:MAG: BlaI/MecI/CopY family transcriptional regulator [Gammaproteobacteria bacterium]